MLCAPSWEESHHAPNAHTARKERAPVFRPRDARTPPATAAADAERSASEDSGESSMTQVAKNSLVALYRRAIEPDIPEYR